MANITPEKRLELSGRAVQIRDAVQDGENTQYRVGSLLEEIVEYLGGSSSGPGPTPVELEGILASLNGMSNPSDSNRILEWNGSKWIDIPTPTGGSGGGITLNQVWDSLAANDGNSNYHQIHPSHLLNALADYVSNTKLKSTEDLYTWWGRRMVEDPTTHKLSVSGNMTGVGSITFTNNVRIVPEENKTLRIEDATGNSIAHIYATGGVSALGNSSSGGDTPTPGGSELHYLLQFVNSYDSYSSDINPNNIEDGSTLRWNGDSWIIDKTAFDDIAWQNVSGNSGYLKKTVTQGVASYTWSPVESSTVTLDYLYNIGDVGTDSGYTNTIAPGHILQYSNSKWNNVAFGITAGSANDILGSITLGSNTYSLPQANGNAMGIVKAGTGLSASSGTMALTAATTEALGGIKVGSGLSMGGTNNQVLSVDTTAIATKSSVDNLSGTVGTLSGNLTTLSNKFATDKYVWGQKYVKGGELQSVDGTLTITTTATGDPSTIRLAYPGASYNETKAFIIRQSQDYTELYSKNTGSPLLLYADKTIGIGIGSPSSLTDSNAYKLQVGGSAMVGNNYSDSSELVIGGAVLRWNNNTQSLSLERRYINNGSVTTGPANFYATGGVSALGLSNGTSSIDAMTFGTINVTNTVNLGNSKCFIKKDGTDTVISGKDSIILSADSVGVEGIISIMGMLIYDEENDKTYALNIQAAKNAGILTLVS